MKPHTTAQCAQPFVCRECQHEEAVRAARQEFFRGLLPAMAVTVSFVFAAWLGATLTWVPESHLPVSPTEHPANWRVLRHDGVACVVSPTGGLACVPAEGHTPVNLVCRCADATCSGVTCQRVP